MDIVGFNIMVVPKLHEIISFFWRPDAPLAYAWAMGSAVAGTIFLSALDRLVT